jgi:hypothetical protein
MQFNVEFWAPFIVLAVAIIFFERRFHMLRDLSEAAPQPYSWSRVQLAWWSVIILSSFIGILLKTGNAPTLNESTLVLLGISGVTSTVARMIDVSDMTNRTTPRHQDGKSENFMLDVLSDSNGASVHRFQTFVFNLGFGCWFIYHVLKNFNNADINTIIPDISTNNLILLGISSATYAALKASENKTADKTAAPAANTAPVVDESIEPAVG